MTGEYDNLPAWLAERERYRPGPDRDGFLARNLLAMSSVLAHLRLDDGRAGPLSPSAPAKLLLTFGAILLTSLARNFLFVLVMLAVVLVRACLLPARALSRVAATAAGAASLTALVMLPATLMGQAHAPLWLSAKALASTALVMETALTTPASQLTRSLRALRVPAVVILTLDLALRSIAQLGETAHEVLEALSLRSVGRNTHKHAAMGGVGGVVFLKASKAAQDSYDAMRCRGFDGSYQSGPTPQSRRIDALWVLGFALLVVLFAHLQKAVLP